MKSRFIRIAAAALAVLLLLCSCGFDAEKEFNSIISKYEGGETFSKLKGSIEKYIENYDKELISMRENYERERAKAEEEAGKLFEELFTTNSESRANKIDRQLSDLDAKITALQRELSALEELDMRYFDDEIVALAQRDTADDGKAAWEAVDWLIEHFGYSPRISIEYSGVLGPFRSYLIGDELESRVIDLGRIIEDDEESYDMTVSNVRFADGTPVSSLDAVAIDNPWNAAFQADATAEVWYSYNGFAPAEPQTVEIAIDEPFVPTVPEDAGSRLFLGWSTSQRAGSDAPFFEPGEGITAAQLPADSRRLYAQYIGFHTSFIVNDSEGNDNGEANAGETVTIYPVLENTGTREASIVVGVLDPEVDGYGFRRIGSPNGNFNGVRPGNAVVVADNYSTKATSYDRINRDYFASRLSTARYTIAIPRSAEDGEIEIPISVRIPGGDSLEYTAPLRIHKADFRPLATSYRISDRSGNDDGVINPGETIRFDVLWTAGANSDPGRNVTAQLSSSDPSVIIRQGRATYKSIEEGRYSRSPSGSYNSRSSGQNALNATSSNAFEISVLPSCTSSTLDLEFRLVDSIGATRTVPFILPVANVDADVRLTKWEILETTGDGDGRVSPGETVRFGYVFRNAGESDLLNAKVVFSTETEGVTLRDSTASWKSINAGLNATTWSTNTSSTDTGIRSDRGLEIIVGRGYEPGTPIVLDWKATGSGSSAEGWTGSVRIPVVESQTDATIAGYRFFDPKGNDDGIVSPGEEFKVDVAIKNSGKSDLRMLSYRFSTDSEYITITSPGPYRYERKVAPGSTFVASRKSVYTSSSYSYTANGEATFRVSSAAPVGSREEIKVLISDGINAWERSIWVTIKNPDSHLRMQRRTIIDTGNGDGTVNVGETGYLDFVVFNDGESDIANATARISTETPGIIITKGSYSFGEIRGGTYKSIKSGGSSYTSSTAPSVSSSMSSKSDNCLSFRVAGDAEIGTRAEVVLTLSNGYESWDHPIAFTIEKASLGVDADISVIGKEPYELVYPGETLELYVSMKNTSSNSISGVRMSMSSDSPYFMVNQRTFSLSDSISKGSSRTTSIYEGKGAPSISYSAPVGERIKVTYTIMDSTGVSKDFDVYYTVGVNGFDPVVSQKKVTGLDGSGAERIVPGGYAFLDAAVLNRGPVSGDVSVRFSSSDPAITVNTGTISVGEVRSGQRFVLSSPSDRFGYSSRDYASSMLPGGGAEVRIADDAESGRHEVTMTILSGGLAVMDETFIVTVE